MAQSQRTYLYFDLLGIVASGLAIGYGRQRVADSGEAHLDKILISMLIAVAAYLATFLFFTWRSRSSRLPTWVLTAVLGSAACAFSLHIIKYVADNWSYRGSTSLVEYLAMAMWGQAGAFVVLTVVYSAFALCIVGVFRLLALQFNSVRSV